MLLGAEAFSGVQTGSETSRGLKDRKQRKQVLRATVLGEAEIPSWGHKH